jgi:hypothetical protein
MSVGWPELVFFLALTVLLTVVNTVLLVILVRRR